MGKINFNSVTDFGFDGILQDLSRYIPITIGLSIYIYDQYNNSNFKLEELPYYIKRNGKDVHLKKLVPYLYVSVIDDDSLANLNTYIFNSSHCTRKVSNISSLDLLHNLSADIILLIKNLQIDDDKYFTKDLELSKNMTDIYAYIEESNQCFKEVKRRLNDNYEIIKSYVQNFYIDAIRFRSLYKSKVEKHYCNIIGYDTESSLMIYKTSLVTTFFYKKGKNWRDPSV